MFTLFKGTLYHCRSVDASVRAVWRNSLPLQISRRQCSRCLKELSITAGQKTPVFMLIKRNPPESAIGVSISCWLGKEPPQKQKQNSWFPVTRPTLYFFYPTLNFLFFFCLLAKKKKKEKEKAFEQWAQWALAKKKKEKRKTYLPTQFFFYPVTRNKHLYVLFLFCLKGQLSTSDPCWRWLKEKWVRHYWSIQACVHVDQRSLESTTALCITFLERSNSTENVSLWPVRRTRKLLNFTHCKLYRNQGRQFKKTGSIKMYLNFIYML